MAHKVLITASTYSHIRSFHLPYLQAFSGLGWTVHVACPAPPREIPGAHAALDVPFTKRMSAPQNLAAARLLRAQIRRAGYDLVISHTSLAAFFTRLAVLGLRRRPRMVNMVHGYLFDQDTPAAKRTLLEGAERLTAPVTDLLLTMNRWDYQFALENRLGRRVDMVPGIGVDFSRFDGVDSRKEALRQALDIPGDAFVFIYGAEFSKRKDQATLLRALARLPEQVWLLLPGRGDLREECIALAQELGIAHRVLLPGQVGDMPSWYGAADAAVSSSRSEGLPFNIMEAMYCRLPVAASDVKGHQDLVEDGLTGLLFPFGDAEACARQMRRLLEDPALARELALRARAQMEQYALPAVLPQVMALYGAAMPAPQPAVN